MPTAIFWPYRFDSIWGYWQKHFLRVSAALQSFGFTIYKHPKIKGEIPGSIPYRGERSCDVVIYNHADLSDIRGDVIDAKHTWFLKPTIPDNEYATLDPLGYAAYSSITYKMPAFDSLSPTQEFKKCVEGWKKRRPDKWSSGFRNTTPSESDYHLIIGQCDGDATVRRQDFGRYIEKLKAVVRELSRVSDRPIVVKMHPFMNGFPVDRSTFAQDVAFDLARISPLVHCYTGKLSVHGFLPKARDVLLANSGAGLEAMMYGKPIIAWGCPEYRWVCYDLRHLCDLWRATRLDWFDAERQNRFLFWYFRHYCISDVKSAVHRIIALLQRREAAWSQPDSSRQT